MRELTLCLLKPSLVKNPIVLKRVHDIIAGEKFQFVHSRKLILSADEAREFYKCHTGRFFFDRLISSMCSGPIVAHILAADNGISKWRELMGPTKVYKTFYTHPHSLRGLFGLSDTRNATHGSDSVESAQAEIHFFFPLFDVNKWYKENDVPELKLQYKQL